MRRTALANLICLFVAALLVACLTPAALPTPTVVPSATATASAVPSDTPTPKPTATNTAVPTATHTASPVPTATDTATPLPTATATATTDPYAGAMLGLADMPTGFKALTDADRAQLHMTDAELQAGFGKAFANSKTHNFAGFANSSGNSGQIFVTYLVYPLTAAEQSAMDIIMADPTTFAKLFASGFATGLQSSGANASTSGVKPLAGMTKFGNKSAGVTTVLTTQGAALRIDIVVVRTKGVLEIYYSFYKDQTQPPASMTSLVKILDGRVAAVTP